MEEELLTTLSRLSNVIGGFVTAVLIPVAGYWGYREYNKRKAAAEAKKAEADNIIVTVGTDFDFYVYYPFKTCLLYTSPSPRD